MVNLSSITTWVCRVFRGEEVRTLSCEDKMKILEERSKQEKTRLRTATRKFEAALSSASFEVSRSE